MHVGKVTAVFRRRMCFSNLQIQQKNTYRISEMLLSHTVSEIRHYHLEQFKSVELQTYKKESCNLEKKEPVERQSFCFTAFVASLIHSIFLGRIFC